MTTNLIVKSLVNNDSVSKTITNINPVATFTQLNSFARKLIGLSTATYVDSDRVQRESVNEGLAKE